MLSTIATREMRKEHINEYLGDCTMNCVRGKYIGCKHNGRSQTGKTQN